MYRYKRYISLILACILIFALVTQSAFAYAATYVLTGLPVTTQSKSNWCWAASSSSVLKYYNHNVSQSSVYRFIKNTVSSNETATASEVRTALTHWGVHSNIKNAKETFTTIRTNIYNYHRPLLAGISNGYSGHLMVICGYDIGTTNTVKIMDPAKTTMQYKSYQTLVSGYYSGYSWVLTLNQIY